MTTIDGEALRLLLETVPEGFFVHDAAGCILDVNAWTCAKLGYRRAELLDLTIGDICPDRPDPADKPVRAIAVQKDGSELRIELSLTSALIEGQHLFFGLLREFAVPLAERDPITGLADRRHFDGELRKACLHATRTGEPLTLALIEIDRFELYDSGRGDEALKATAGVLRTAARRPYDLAVRNGGAEFLLLLPGAEQPEALVGQIVEDIAALGIPCPESAFAPYLTVSCGCVIASELADVGPPDLLAACEGALDRAKADGRNRMDLMRL